MIDPDVAVIVDVQNLYRCAKTAIGGNVDYGKLLQFIATEKERRISQAYAYIIENDVDQSSFMGALKSLGFTVRSKDLITRPDGSVKGNWDVGITIDAIRVCPRVDTIALVSGDGDFAPLVHYMKNAFAVNVEIYGFNRSVSRDLIEAADHAIRWLPTDDTLLYENSSD